MKALRKICEIERYETRRDILQAIRKLFRVCRCFCNRFLTILRIFNCCQEFAVDIKIPKPVISDIKPETDTAQVSSNFSKFFLIVSNLILVRLSLNQPILQKILTFQALKLKLFKFHKSKMRNSLNKHLKNLSKCQILQNKVKHWMLQDLWKAKITEFVDIICIHWD